MRRAAKVAATGQLVLFGIKPTEPHTGYGYIRQGAALEGFTGGAFAVDAFVEKPDTATAERYLADGDYFWNSGIFVLHARTFLDELARLAAGILEAAARRARQAPADDLGFLRLDRRAFAPSPNISVDYAVMEKTDLAAMLPIDVGWNDVGSWSSLWDVAPHDAHGNFVNGDAHPGGHATAATSTPSARSSPRSASRISSSSTRRTRCWSPTSRASQDVSKIVKRLKQSNRKEQEQHLRNYRPVGLLRDADHRRPRFQVKLLHVKPGGKLSMQMHHHRSEHWVVVQGTAKVVIGDIEKLVRENESVYIFATQWHRLENPGKVPLEIIEVQIGTYLGEDDIVRTDDVYNRAADETR